MPFESRYDSALFIEWWQRNIPPLKHSLADIALRHPGPSCSQALSICAQVLEQVVRIQDCVRNKMRYRLICRQFCASDSSLPIEPYIATRIAPAGTSFAELFASPKSVIV